MSLCAWPGLSWCPPFAGLFGGVGGSFARGFIFLVGFRIGPTFAVMLLLFAAICSVSLVLAQFGRTHVWTGQGHIFATLPYKRRAPSWIKLKPEDLKEQIGKLAEKSMTPSFVDVTLRDGFGVPQVKLITGIKILRILKKEGLAPSIPEVLYFLVKKAKSMRKHLDENRKDRDSKFRLILVESCIHRLARYCRRVKFLPANWKYVSATASTGTCDAPFGDECINFFGRSKRFSCDGSFARAFKECDPNVSVRRIEASFRKGGEGQFPFGNPLTAASDPFKDAKVFRVRVFYIYLSGEFEHSLSGMKGNSLS